MEQMCRPQLSCHAGQSAVLVVFFARYVATVVRWHCSHLLAHLPLGGVDILNKVELHGACLYGESYVSVARFAGPDAEGKRYRQFAERCRRWTAC